MRFEIEIDKVPLKKRSEKKEKEPIEVVNLVSEESSQKEPQKQKELNDGIKNKEKGKEMNIRINDEGYGGNLIDMREGKNKRQRINKQTAKKVAPAQTIDIDNLMNPSQKN